MSFSQSQDKYIRNFINYGSKNITQGLPSMEEPTYMGFSVFFDWNNISYKSDPQEITTGLLLQGDDSDSAINYLLRKGKDDPAAALNKFIQILKDIEENKPWMFQSVDGLNTIWGGNKPDSAWKGKDIILTINCLETLDTRMGFLASLYNHAIYDRIWQRNNLPFNKRKFNCKIIITEMRNLGTMVSKDIHPDVSSIKSQAGGLSPIGTTISPNEITGPIPTKETLMSSGIQSDISAKTAMSGQNIANFGQGVANKTVDWSTKTIDYQGLKQSNIGTAVSGTTNNSAAHTNSVNTTNSTLDKISQLKVNNVFSNLDKTMTFYVFELYDCEFIFNEAPFLENVNINNFSEPSTFKFQIKVGYPTEAHQFRFFNWIINDYYDSMLVAKDDTKLHSEISIPQSKVYNDNNIMHYEAKTKYRIDSFNPIQTEIKKQSETQKLTNQQPAGKGNTWDAIANSYKGTKEIDNAVSQLSGGSYKGVDNATKNKLSEIKSKIDSKNIQLSNNSDNFLKALNTLNLDDHYSILNAAAQGYDLSKKAFNKEPVTNWDPNTKPTVKTNNDIVYNVIRTLNSEQLSSNRFWANVGQTDWKNISNSTDYLNKSTQPQTITNVYGNRIEGNNTLKINARLGLNSPGIFKNTRFSNDYLKQYDYPTKNDDSNIKYNVIRTVYDVPSNPDKILSERPGFTSAQKEWKNLGLGLPNNDKTDLSGKYNYLNKLERLEPTINKITLSGPKPNTVIMPIKLIGPNKI